MIVEIINPSDPYTMQGDDFGVLCAACLLLGSGAYSITQLDAADGAEPLEMPLFLLNGDAAVPWFKEKFGADLGSYFEDRPSEVADALASVLIGHLDNRKLFEHGLSLIDDPAKRQEWRDRWHDENRTSMNDIGAKALRLAARLRKEPAPA